jgi:hypothetical protein
MNQEPTMVLVEFIDEMLLHRIGGITGTYFDLFAALPGGAGFAGTVSGRYYAELFNVGNVG